jgi:hypothetical protein
VVKKVKVVPTAIPMAQSLLTYPFNALLIIIKLVNMKNVQLKLAALTVATASIFAFTSVDMQAVSIKGSVSPADAATRAWVISKSDTVQARIDKGTFEIPMIKPGTYQVIIEAKAPYKSTGRDGVPVVAGKPTDMGEIKLEKGS